MTKPELDAIARRLFPLLPHPKHPDEPWYTNHLIAPPDPMDWAVFGQLLMWLTSQLPDRDILNMLRGWFDDVCVKKDPRIALLLAVAKMKGVAE